MGAAYLRVLPVLQKRLDLRFLARAMAALKEDRHAIRAGANGHMIGSDIRENAAIRPHWRWLASCTLLSFAWAAGGAVAAGTLQGTAIYRERVALPPSVVFEAPVQDISRANAPGEVLGRARLKPAEQPPFRLAIASEDAAIKPARRYAVRATVTFQGRLLFSTNRIYPVLDGGNAPLVILLVSARGARHSILLRRGDENLRPLLASLESSGTPLRGTYWKLVRLGQTPVQAVGNQRQPHLIFAANEPQVSGNGGCNSISGSFELDGEKLRLRHMVSTMMACPSGMEQERRFLRSLEKVARFRISGGRLEMFDAAGAVIAQFEAMTQR